MRFFVLAFAIICAIFDYFNFSSNFNSHTLQIVTLEQKLRKSFFGEIEFLAPSCSAGSVLTPNQLMKVLRAVLVLRPFF